MYRLNEQSVRQNTDFVDGPRLFAYPNNPVNALPSLPRNPPIRPRWTREVSLSLRTDLAR